MSGEGRSDLAAVDALGAKGELVGRADRAVDLPPAVVGDDYPVEAVLHGERGVFRVLDALDQDRQLGEPAQGLHLVPGQRRVGIDLGEQGRGGERVLFRRLGQHLPEHRIVLERIVADLGVDQRIDGRERQRLGPVRIDGRPRYVKRSLDDSEKVKTAAIDPDFA